MDGKGCLVNQQRPNKETTPLQSQRSDLHKSSSSRYTSPRGRVMLSNHEEVKSQQLAKFKSIGRSLRKHQKSPISSKLFSSQSENKRRKYEYRQRKSLLQSLDPLEHFKSSQNSASSELSGSSSHQSNFKSRERRKEEVSFKSRQLPVHSADNAINFVDNLKAVYIHLPATSLSVKRKKNWILEEKDNKPIEDETVPEYISVMCDSQKNSTVPFDSSDSVYVRRVEFQECSFSSSQSPDRQRSSCEMGLKEPEEDIRMVYIVQENTSERRNSDEMQEEDEVRIVAMSDELDH